MILECGCGEEISEARWKLGYRTCLDCGAQEANVRTQQLKRCAAPAYNKGAYQPMFTRQDVLDAGRK